MYALSRKEDRVYEEEKQNYSQMFRFPPNTAIQKVLNEAKNCEVFDDWMYDYE